MAVDNVDGDITGNILVTNNVNINFIGFYTVNYRVSDISGNQASIDRTVNVVDTTAPVITLNGNNPATVQVANRYPTVKDGKEYAKKESTISLPVRNIMARLYGGWSWISSFNIWKNLGVPEARIAKLLLL